MKKTEKIFSASVLSLFHIGKAYDKNKGYAHIKQAMSTYLFTKYCRILNFCCNFANPNNNNKYISLYL